LRVLGEVSRRFVVTPDIDTLLAAMTQADEAAAGTKFMVCFQWTQHSKHKQLNVQGHD